MDALKTKTIKAIEDRMGGMQEDTIRYSVLMSAKKFKSSWLELGQALYSVWKDKLYKEWDFLTFEAYTAKEIGVRKQTALKLLKSYMFLEKEEPEIVRKDYVESNDAKALPSYESVNVLRLAKNNKDIDSGDYASIRRSVLELGKEAKDVKKDLTAIMRQREDVDPAAAREKKRYAAVRRLVSTLKALKNEIEVSKLASASVIKETAALIKRLEMEIETDDDNT